MDTVTQIKRPTNWATPGCGLETAFQLPCHYTQNWEKSNPQMDGGWETEQQKSNFSSERNQKSDKMAEER